MKLLIDRKKILLEILNLEVEINELMKDPIYIKNKHYLNLLEGERFGSAMILVPSPDDPSKMLRIRNNSQEMRAIRSKYRVSQSGFDGQLDELHNKKDRLQGQLFNRTL